MATASGFLDILGINTHAGHASGTYQNSSLTIQSLSYLGIDTVRDGMRSSGMTVELMKALGAAGIKFDFVVPSDVPASGAAGLQEFISTLEAFNAAHPGSIVSIEGLNEFNLYSFNFNGDTTVSGAVAFQKALYAAVNHSASLADVPVINFSIGMDDKALFDAAGDLSDFADFANSHSYTHTRGSIDSTQEYQLSLAKAGASRDPVVITETGYTTLEKIDYLGTSEAAQAKLILNGLFDAYENGVQKVYLYELFDGNTGDQGDKEAHFGLFHSDGTPKDAAVALHNLTTILSFGDTGSGVDEKPIGYSLTGLPDSGHSLALTKGSGVSDIVIWAEPKIWNDIANKDISNPDKMVTVKLASVQALIYVYDPLKGTDPIAVYRNTDTIRVPVSDHPIIVEIGASGPVRVDPVKVAADQTMSSAEFVAKIDFLASAAGLESIKLTDGQTLHVSSLATMKHMITEYQHVLSKIEGGFSFSIDLKGKGWSLTSNYDASGKMTSEVHYAYNAANVLTNMLTVYADGSRATDIFTDGKLTQETRVDKFGESVTSNYSDGVVKSVYIKHVDGTSESYDYKIVGQAYTTQHQIFNTKGTLIVIERSNASGIIEKIVNDANGKIVSSYQVSADGKEMFTAYASGVPKSLNIHYADGRSEAYDYNIVGKSYTTQHQIFNADGVLIGLERMGANGKFVYTETRSGTDMVYGIYNSTGVRIETTTVHKDGSKDSYFYDSSNPSAYVFKSLAANGALTRSVVKTAAGEETSTKYVNGVKTAVYIKHANGTADSFDYGVSGQPWTTQHQVFNEKGILVCLERSGPGGWSQTLNFDSSGKTTSSWQRGSDGKETTYSYINGSPNSLFIRNADGSTEAYNYNITGKSYVTQHQTFSKDGQLVVLERLGQNNKMVYTETRSGTDTIFGIYDAQGARTETTTVHKDGSKESYFYDTKNTGAYTYKALEANGSLKQMVVVTATGEQTSTKYTAGIKASEYVRHSDGSAESFEYNLSSKIAYLAKHQQFSSSGALIAIETFNQNGNLTYSEIRKNGDVSYGIYNSAGTLVEITTVKANGVKDSVFYANDASGTVTHQVWSSGVLSFSDVKTNDGKHFVTAYSLDSTLKGGSANDTFVFKPTASGSVVFDGGNDKITGFQSAGSSQPDHILLASTYAHSFSDLTIKQAGSDVLITIDKDNSIALTNFKVADLTSDFITFV